MTYYNRRQQLINTLNSIAKYAIDDMEVIVVDDASTHEHEISNLEGQYPFKLNIIRIEPHCKKHINPCVSFNIGFVAASKDIVIIQNAEAYHVGNILGYTLDHITDNNYLNYSCYNLPKNKVDALTENPERFLSSFVPTGDRSDYPNAEGWYNHPTIKAKYFHFCSAITKANLDKLNGFDVRFADGIGWDDWEFAHRVQKILTIDCIIEPYVLHQHHYNESSWNHLDVGGLGKVNQKLWDEVKASNEYRANKDSYYGHRD